jgi:hypothetical protein
MTSSFLAHVPGSPVRNAVQVALLLGAFGLAWGAVRLRGVRLFGRGNVVGPGVAVLALATLASAFIVPSRFGPKVASVRPSSNARLVIVSPRSGVVLAGNPATVRIRLRLIGARIVTYTSSYLVRDRGHIHLFLDGDLLAMLYGTSTTTYAYPGRHRLEAEFVAVDHGPFSPPVTASSAFRVVP